MAESIDVLFQLDLPPNYLLALGTVVIILAVYAIYRRLDVRLVLLVAALVLGTLADRPTAIIRTFFATFVNEKFVIPICTAMGFAYVLRHTGCDQHLVHLLVRPLTRVRLLLIPGTVVVGFLVNMPIVSQTSTAVTIGTVLIPVLLAARLSPVTIGAALLLGSSIGGELLNPGAPELRTTITETAKAAERLQVRVELTSEDCVHAILPLNLVGLVVATVVFWLISLRQEKRAVHQAALGTQAGLTHAPSSGITADPSRLAPASEFVVNPVKAAVPLVPLVLLYLLAPPLKVWEIPFEWLEDVPRHVAPPGRFESRLIGLAMLIGCAVAAVVAFRRALGVAAAFCEGAGYGFTNIISLIVGASCFGEGIRLIGVDRVIGSVIQDQPALLVPAAGLVSLGFAVLCGSGMATAQSVFPFFAEPCVRLDIDPAHVGAVVSLAAAAGRTMSPVAAVTLMSATMTRTNPLALIRRLTLPILAGVAAFLIAAMLMAPSR